MSKNIKLNIKNSQIAQALNLGSVKDKLAKKKAETEETPAPVSTPAPTPAPIATQEVAKKAKKEPAKKEPVKAAAPKPKAVEAPVAELHKEDAPKAKARSKSVFAGGPEHLEMAQHATVEDDTSFAQEEEYVTEEFPNVEPTLEQAETEVAEEAASPTPKFEEPVATEEPVIEVKMAPPAEEEPAVPKKAPIVAHDKRREPIKWDTKPAAPYQHQAPAVRLGPTGRHINDLLPPKKPAPTKPAETTRPASTDRGGVENRGPAKPRAKEETQESIDAAKKKGMKPAPKAKDFKDMKPAKRSTLVPDSRDRYGRDADGESRWRKKRSKQKFVQEDTTIRPTSLKIRLPISIKDLASEMKLKASQLIEKLFMQGIALTLNDLLDDETTIQLLGHEFGCEITIDTTEAERIAITDKTVTEEIAATESDKLMMRAPVVAFMGHVDHGKTSLIDAIRKSNRVAGEAGAITQHIGAFTCSTAVGNITVLDTPGHEAFHAMRARGADVTDIVVLVVAGDEGMRAQTIEAIQHAKTAGVTIVVAINKCDKPNFNPEQVYRQLSDQELLPEAWGGQTITINCSAMTGEGVPQLLEMLALQAEVLELHANPSGRARGVVLESEMHKGMGSVATVLVQNGTLKHGDAIVFDRSWGRVKTMQDEHGRSVTAAGPSTPVEITGLSMLPTAGEEFIVVASEKEARDISSERAEKGIFGLQQRKAINIDNMVSHVSDQEKKVLNVILRADVQGSLEAVKTALEKILSDKVVINIISSSVGEVTESDVQLSNASKAVIIGFHTKIESHAEKIVKQYGVQVKLFDVIYHAIDATKEMMANTLDKLAQEVEKGKAEVRAIFKSSHHGVIAGCFVTEGPIVRNQSLRIIREGKEIWKGPISSLRRVKEDVKEIQKGFECGILLSTNDIKEGDILETFEIIYIKQQL